MSAPDNVSCTARPVGVGNSFVQLTSGNVFVKQRSTVTGTLVHSTAPAVLVVHTSFENVFVKQYTLVTILVVQTRVGQPPGFVEVTRTEPFTWPASPRI